MTDAIWNAAALVIVALVGVVGGRINAKAAAEKAARQTAELMCYRIDQLEKKVDKHNSLVEWKYEAAQKIADVCKMAENNQDRLDNMKGE